VTGMLRIALAAVALLAVGLGGAFAVGGIRWRASTRDLLDRLGEGPVAGTAASPIPTASLTCRDRVATSSTTADHA